MHPKKHLIIAALTISAIILMVISAAVRFTPRLFYNPSGSAPVGWYWLAQNANVNRGDYVLLTLPEPIRLMALERRYLPPNVPMLKQVFALEGDHICIRNGQVAVNKNVVAEVQKTDSLGRPLPQNLMCRTLRSGEVFVLNPELSDSFDSRYFGPLMMDHVIGRAVPLWVTGRAGKERGNTQDKRACPHAGAISLSAHPESRPHGKTPGDKGTASICRLEDSRAPIWPD